MRNSRIWVKLIDDWSKRILKVVFISFVIIIILQSFMKIDEVRQWIVPAERWEGTPYLLP